MLIDEELETQRDLAVIFIVLLLRYSHFLVMYLKVCVCFALVLCASENPDLNCSVATSGS